ncbi:MAG: WbuC family cupin fold metalloprotein [Burkholderiaceae bacterium]
MKRIGQDELHALQAKADRHPRGRLNLNLHGEPDDPVQRLLIAMNPGSYVRVHQHPDQWEMLMVVRGAFTLLTFDDERRVLTRSRLQAGNDDPDALLLAELPARTWHTLLCDARQSLFLEVKPGPYTPANARHADWAPSEGSTGVTDLLRFFSGCSVGDKAPG